MVSAISRPYSFAKSSKTASLAFTPSSPKIPSETSLRDQKVWAQWYSKDLTPGIYFSIFISGVSPAFRTIWTQWSWVWRVWGTSYRISD